MISSQNNVRKYRTKGHEEVSYLRLFRIVIHFFEDAGIRVKIKKTNVLFVGLSENIFFIFRFHLLSIYFFSQT